MFALYWVVTRVRFDKMNMYRGLVLFVTEVLFVAENTYKGLLEICEQDFKLR